MKLRNLIIVTGLASLTLLGYASAKYRSGVHNSVFEQMDLAKQKVSEGKKNEAIGYAEALLMNQTIKVGVEFGKTPQSQIPAADKAVNGAIQMWEVALNQGVHFERVPFEEGDIKIRFQEDVKLHGQVVSGYVNWTRTIAFSPEGVKPIFNADVFLTTVDPRGQLMTADSMRHTCGHEFGHVLGLDDNPTVGVLMGPLDIKHPVAKPTDAEIATVKTIRAEFEGFVTETKGLDGCEFVNLGK